MTTVSCGFHGAPRYSTIVKLLVDGLTLVNYRIPGTHGPLVR